MRKRILCSLVLFCFLLSGCAKEGLSSLNPFLKSKEIVTFSDSLYRPHQEFEKIGCDSDEDCYMVSTEMEAGLLIGNLLASGSRKVALLTKEDLDLDRVFLYAYIIAPSAFEAQYSQRRQFNGERRTLFEFKMENEDQLKRDQAYAQVLVDTLVTESMSDQEKVEAIHDYLILHTRYDEEATKLDAKGRKQNLSFKAAGLFEASKATCSGYMEAFDLMVKTIGIGDLRIFSNSMDHAWNLINLDGEMYYVDATFDDPVPDQGNRIIQDFLLLSPVQLQAQGKHYFDESTPTSLSEEDYQEYFNYLFA